MPLIKVAKPGHRWPRQWKVGHSTKIHYPNHWCLIVRHTLNSNNKWESIGDKIFEWQICIQIQIYRLSSSTILTGEGWVKSTWYSSQTAQQYNQNEISIIGAGLQYGFNTLKPGSVEVTLFSNIIHEQNTSNTNLTNKAYPGYCKHVLCWRPPEKALAYLAGGNKIM